MGAYDKVVYYVYMMELVDQPAFELLAQAGVRFRGNMSPKPAEVNAYAFTFVWEFFTNQDAVQRFNEISPVAQANPRYALTPEAVGVITNGLSRTRQIITGASSSR